MMCLPAAFVSAAIVSKFVPEYEYDLGLENGRRPGIGQ